MPSPASGSSAWCCCARAAAEDEAVLRRCTPIGCAGVITHVERLPDGRYNIVLRGVGEVPGADRGRCANGYRLASVEPLPERVAPDEPARDCGRGGERVEALLERRLRDVGSESTVPREMADEHLVNALAQVPGVRAGREAVAAGARRRRGAVRVADRPAGDAAGGSRQLPPAAARAVTREPQAPPQADAWVRPQTDAWVRPQADAWVRRRTPGSDLRRTPGSIRRTPDRRRPARGSGRSR